MRLILHKHIFIAAITSLLFTSAINQATAAASEHTQSAVMKYLQDLVSEKQGIGARLAGSKEEKLTAQYITDKFTQFGYKVEQQEFSFKGKSQRLTSSNIIAELSANSSKPIIILAAHYDSTAKHSGSMGATDNGAGVAAMLEIAQVLANNASNNYQIRFIAFGAEEIGVLGSNYYMKKLVEQQQTKNIIAMINFDTIAGGDFVYVHSAHSQPYRMCKEDTYTSKTTIRDALLLASKKVLGEKHQYIIHPATPNYPKGETGPWSDHASFACAGIPIAYVEATNFTINGEDGFDGYSQSTKDQLWQCYDANNLTSCDRENEHKWGKIWHTKYDRLSALEAVFPGRIEKQLTNNVKVLVELLSHPDKYFQY